MVNAPSKSASAAAHRKKRADLRRIARESANDLDAEIVPGAAATAATSIFIAKSTGNSVYSFTRRFFSRPHHPVGFVFDPSLDDVTISSLYVRCAVWVCQLHERYLVAPVRLGSGAWCSVFSARHLLDGRHVALKIIEHSFASNARLLRKELAVLAALPVHANVLRYHDAFVLQDRCAHEWWCGG